MATIQLLIACLHRSEGDLPTRAMKNYRVLVFDMGHINAVVELSASDDDAAITEAKKHFPTEQREVWELNRFVIKLQPQEA